METLEGNPRLSEKNEAMFGAQGGKVGTAERGREQEGLVGCRWKVLDPLLTSSGHVYMIYGRGFLINSGEKTEFPIQPERVQKQTEPTGEREEGGHAVQEDESLWEFLGVAVEA